MLADLTTIFLEVIRILTFQSGRPARPVTGKPLLTTRIPTGCDNRGGKQQGKTKTTCRSAASCDRD